MSGDLSNNPFAALFGSVKEAEQFSKSYKDELQPLSEIKSVERDKSSCCGRDDCSRRSGTETSLLESLLMLTTNPNGPHPAPRVLMDDSEGILDLQSFPQVLFERLLLESPSNNVVGAGSQSEVEDAGQSHAVVYLFNCYARCCAQDTPQCSVIKAVQSAVVTNLGTAVEQPEVYFGQNIEQQLKDILLRDLPTDYYTQDLLNKLTQHLQEQESPRSPTFDQVLVEVTSRLSEASLMTLDYQLINILDYYSLNPFLATCLTKRPDETNQDRSGRGYQNTPLGSLLSVSCLPKHLGQNYHFFQNPTKQQASDIKATENSIWMAQNTLNNRLHKFFRNLLKVSSEGRSGLLSWVEGCLEANSGRAGLWQVHGQVQGTMYVCDGFMVNLGAVMLQLAQPFTQEPKSPKILKIDHRYCKSPSSSTGTNGGVEGAYTGDLGKQTCLVPPPEGEEDSMLQETPDQYSFISSCFFLTHRALHLGVQVVCQKLYKMEQEVGRLRHQYQEIVASGTATQLVRQQMENTMESRTTQLFSLKAAIFEPNTSDNLLQFMATSAEWMVQCALRFHPDAEPASEAPQKLLEVKVPLPPDEVSHPALQCIPEFLVENLTETIKATRRYNAQIFDFGTGSQALPHLMSFIVVFMGSPGRMNNPHLRAHLAEILEILLPNNESSIGMMAGVREQLFTSHSASPHIVTAIIHVFVTIEVSAQAVAFEEKFNYRKPMYEIMKYLWGVPVHQERYKELASEALANMESAKPPLFLKFVNVLINDAIFLLGEGLDYMMQIKKLLKERDDGEWDTLTPEQKREKESSVHHTTLLARFHNMMGTSTIRTLIRLTKEMPQMFTHPTLVDRMAAMLNYFLAHLVGPKRRDLKVNDMDKYEFRPSEMVKDICTIYTHLGSDDAFCLAISQDGRSYSAKLFQQAHDVLCRVGGGGLAGDILELQGKVEAASQANQEVEDLATEAPEEFLDPIMSHLMTDPVTLPSSQIVCDRSTIARHLLSDQTDPFNRAPLTMEEVLSNTELKDKINQWLIQKKAERQKMESEMT
ncbi:unnamed protein product [Meganyctiphanes norvegica]|uniref:Ubiquitin conjugation factor E4 A n=1 Tax=Meganyctiphanes norvegica TaxID=48144 RepID=A0AAV2PUA3_MEGNR